MKIGIYGTGIAAKGFIQFLLEKGYPIAGLITSTEARAAAVQEELGLPCTTSLDALLAHSPDIDLMLVANANEAHREATLESLAKGMHVYCEKPMANTLPECLEMVEATQQSAGHLQIGFEYIHSAMPRRVTELIKEGFFGETVSAHCLDSRGHWWSGDPDAPFEKQTKLRRECGGGIVFHCGVHQLDMLRAFLGEFTDVQAIAPSMRSLPYYPKDVPDQVQVILRGARGQVGSLSIFHNRAPTWYRSPLPEGQKYEETPGHEFKLSLTGTGGSCVADFYGGLLHLFRYDHDQKETVFEGTEDFRQMPQNERHHDMSGFLHRFLQSIEAGNGPLTPPEDAYKTMELAFAVEESISCNKPVILG